MKNISKYFVFSLLLSSFVLGAMVTISPIKAAFAGEKIKICHANPPETAAGGYEALEISVNALSGHDGHAMDIIPPFPDYSGQNWNEEGQAIWENNCVVPSTDPGDGEDPEVATIIAQKIICNDEADLPNWGAGGADITSTTATDYVASHPNCQLAPNWDFEWSLDGVGNPGDNILSGGTGWNSFSNTANATVPTGGKIWVREKYDSRYIPFTGENTDQDVSAEIYCNNDVLNYDNLEWIDPVESGQTYHCVAFNTPKACSVVSDETTIVEGGTNAVETWDGHTGWYQSDLLSPAKWIWDAFHVANPTQEETKVFIKKFSLDAEPISASISVAADNGYSLVVNDQLVTTRLAQSNYDHPAVYTHFASLFHPGTNTIKLTVKNFAMPDGTPETNPAGVLYKVTFLGSADCANVAEPETSGKIKVRKAFANIEGMQVEPSAFSFSVNGGEPQSFGFSDFVEVNVPNGPYSIAEIDPGSEWAVSTSTGCAGEMAGEDLECVITNTHVDSEPEESTDVCPNIEGIQETVPDGKILGNGNCIDQQSSGGGGGSSGGGSFGYFYPQVLGVSTTTGRVLGESTCAPYLKSYIKFGGKNDKDEVMKLQTFLNEYLGLNIKVDGKYTARTYRAVKQFQVGAHEQVLKPWIPFGLEANSDGTGYVYKTTKRWINMIKCPQLALGLPQLP